MGAFDDLPNSSGGTALADDPFSDLPDSEDPFADLPEQAAPVKPPDLNRGLEVAREVIGDVMGALTSPAVAEASRMGRREIAKAPLRFEKGVLEKEGALAQAGIGAANVGEFALRSIAGMEPTALARQIAFPNARPVLPPEAATRAVEFLDPFGVAPEGSARQGAQQFVGETVSGLTSPDAALALAAGKYIPASRPYVGRYFQLPMIQQSGEAAGRLAQAETPGEAVKAGLETAMTVGAPLLIEGGMVAPPGRAIPLATGEALRMPEGYGPRPKVMPPRAEVPGTPAESRAVPTPELEALIEEQQQIKTVRATNARTKAEVQALFPDMNRQQAAQLRDKVWGKATEAAPEAPEAPKPLAAAPPAAPEAIPPVQTPPGAAKGPTLAPVASGPVRATPATGPKPEVARLADSPHINGLGDPIGTAYHATPEDWSAWQGLVQPFKDAIARKDFAEATRIGGQREAIKNKYGGMPPEAPKPAAPAPPAAPKAPEVAPAAPAVEPPAAPAAAAPAEAPPAAPELSGKPGELPPVVKESLPTQPAAPAPAPAPAAKAAEVQKVAAVEDTPKADTVQMHTVKEGNEIRVRAVVPKSMMPGRLGEFAVGSAPKTKAGDYILDSGWVLSKQQALDKLRYKMEAKHAEIGGATQDAYNRDYQAHEAAAQPIREAINEHFRVERIKANDTAIKDLQAGDIPAIWVDEEVITPRGKYEVQDDGKLKLKQSLSQAGFDKNLDYVSESLKNSPQNEGRWFGANKSARARISEIETGRSEKAKVESEKKAKADAEEASIRADNDAYRQSVDSVELPKGKKTKVTIPMEDRTTGKKSTEEREMTAYGPWAIRKNELSNAKSGYKYFITHVPTGLSVGSHLKIGTLAEAQRLIKGLIYTGVDAVKKEFANDELGKLASATEAFEKGDRAPQWWIDQKPKEPAPAAAEQGAPGDVRLSPSDKAKTPEEKAFRATAEGQKAMASRASRIGTLQMMNEAIRKLDPNEAYDRAMIEGLPDSQIDAWMEDLRQNWNKVKAAAEQGAEGKIGGRFEERAKLMSRLTKGKVKFDDLPDWAKQDKDFQDIQAQRDARLAQSNEFLEALGTEEEGGEGKIVGMGGAVPGEFAASGQTQTSIKNRIVDKERAERGEPPMMDVVRRGREEVWQKAMAILDRDPGAREKLVAELIREPRAIDDYEVALLDHLRVDLKNEYAKATREAAQAADDGRLGDLDRLNGVTEMWSDKLLELEKAAGKGGAGTATARGLAYRRQMVNDDFTLATLELEARKARGYRKLTPDERATLAAQADAHKAKADALEKRLAEVEAAQDAKDIQASVEKAKREAEPKPAPIVIKMAEQIVAAWDKRADAARSRIRERMARMGTSPDPTLILDLAEVGLSRAGHVALDAAKFADHLRSEFGDWVRPHVEAAWTKLQELIAREQKKAAPGTPRAKAMDAAVKKPTNDIGILQQKIQSRIAKNGEGDISYHVRKLVRMLIETEGIKDANKLVDRVHGILLEVIPDITRREAMDAISGYGKFRPLTRDAVSVIQRDLGGQLQQIGKLEDMAAGEAPKKTGPERRTPSDEERRLIKQVEEAKRQGGYRVTDPETQLRSAMQAVHTRLSNQIKDLEFQIAKREKIVKEPRKLAYDAEANRLVAQRDELKHQFDEIFPKQPITEAERLARWKANVLERTAELKQRLAAGDFSKRQARAPVQMDSEALRLRFDMHTIERQILEGRAAEQRKLQSAARKGLRYSGEVINAFRAMKTSFDLSAVLRQGGFIGFAHPIRAVKSFPAMFKALLSDRGQFAAAEEIRNRPNAPLYEQAKLYLAEHGGRLSSQEEVYMSRWASKIPGVRASERAYVTFLNKLRADSFDAMAATLSPNGQLTLPQAKVVANFINVATGRGSVALDQAAVALNTAFFAPRYVASRFQLLSGQPLWGGGAIKGTGNVRGLIVKEYARTLAGAGVVFALGLAAGGTVETDPRSADFGKIKFGNTRIDPLFGLIQSTVLASRLASGETKTVKGKVVPIRGEKVPFGSGDASDVVWRFIRSKLSPAVGETINIASGRDVVGNPVTAKSIPARLIAPIGVVDIYQAMQDQGVEKGTAMAILSLFGMGLQTYTQKK